MANDIATTIITCRLTEDMKVISPKLAALRVAFNSYNGTEEEGNFIDVKLLGDRWQKGIADYLVKGARIALAGDLREEKWEAKEGGKRSKHVILARDIALMGSKADSGQGGYPAKGTDFPPAPPAAPADDMSW